MLASVGAIEAGRDEQVVGHAGAEGDACQRAVLREEDASSRDEDVCEKRKVSVCKDD